jgi:nucleotide-binding universal stress UspA family protein
MTMEKPSADLGNCLLIAVDDTPGSLAMIKAAARQLPDPQHTEVTLIHYLAPVFWEYGGGSPETAHYLAEQAQEQEEEEDELTHEYFDEARAVLQEAGIAPEHIHTKENWSANDVSEAVLNELRSDAYTGVVIGKDHHDALARLLHMDLAHTIRRHTEATKVWVVDSTVN